MLRSMIIIIEVVVIVSCVTSYILYIYLLTLVSYSQAGLLTSVSSYLTIPGTCLTSLTAIHLLPDVSSNYQTYYGLGN